VSLLSSSRFNDCPDGLHRGRSLRLVRIVGLRMDYHDPLALVQLYYYVVAMAFIEAVDYVLTGRGFPRSRINLQSLKVIGI
jgi:hypothetical protein